MQIVHGEPGTKVPPASCASLGILPIAGLALAGTGTSIVIWRYEVAFAVEHLDAVIAPIGNINIVFGIYGDCMRRGELTRSVSTLAP